MPAPAACQMLDKWALTAPSPSPFWAVGSCGLQAELCVPHQAVAMGIHTAHWEHERGQDLGGRGWAGRGWVSPLTRFVCMRRLRLVPGCVGPRVVFLQPEFVFLDLS